MGLTPYLSLANVSTLFFLSQKAKVNIPLNLLRAGTPHLAKECNTTSVSEVDLNFEPCFSNDFLISLKL